MHSIEYISAIATFFTVGTIIWFALDVKLWYLKPFDYKPFNCRKCLTFWVLTAISIFAFIINHYVYAVTLFALAALNAVAMSIDEVNNG